MPVRRGAVAFCRREKYGIASGAPRSLRLLHTRLTFVAAADQLRRALYSLADFLPSPSFYHPALPTLLSGRPRSGLYSILRSVQSSAQQPQLL